jgi:hypothetical protein
MCLTVVDLVLIKQRVKTFCITYNRLPIPPTDTPNPFQPIVKLIDATH